MVSSERVLRLPGYRRWFAVLVGLIFLQSAPIKCLAQDLETIGDPSYLETYPQDIGVAFVTLTDDLLVYISEEQAVQVLQWNANIWEPIQNISKSALGLDTLEHNITLLGATMDREDLSTIYVAALVANRSIEDVMELVGIVVPDGLSVCSDEGCGDSIIKHTSMVNKSIENVAIQASKGYAMVSLFYDDSEVQDIFAFNQQLMVKAAHFALESASEFLQSRIYWETLGNMTTVTDALGASAIQGNISNVNNCFSGSTTYFTSINAALSNDTSTDVHLVEFSECIGESSSWVIAPVDSIQVTNIVIGIESVIKEYTARVFGNFIVTLLPSDEAGGNSTGNCNIFYRNVSSGSLQLILSLELPSSFGARDIMFSETSFQFLVRGSSEALIWDLSSFVTSLLSNVTTSNYSQTSFRFPPDIIVATALCLFALFFTLLSTNGWAAAMLLKFIQQSASFGLMPLSHAPIEFFHYFWSLAWSLFIGVFFPMQESGLLCSDDWQPDETPIHRFAQAIQIQPQYILGNIWALSLGLIFALVILEESFSNRPQGFRKCFLKKMIRLQHIWVYPLITFTAFSLTLLLGSAWPSCRQGRRGLLALVICSLIGLGLWTWWYAATARDYLRKLHSFTQAKTLRPSLSREPEWRRAHNGRPMVEDYRFGAGWVELWLTLQTISQAVILGTSHLYHEVVCPGFALGCAFLNLIIFARVKPFRKSLAQQFAILVTSMSVVNSIVPLLYALPVLDSAAILGVTNKVVVVLVDYLQIFVNILALAALSLGSLLHFRALYRRFLRSKDQGDLDHIPAIQKYKTQQDKVQPAFPQAYKAKDVPLRLRQPDGRGLMLA